MGIKVRKDPGIGEYETLSERLMANHKKEEDFTWKDILVFFTFLLVVGGSTWYCLDKTENPCRQISDCVALDESGNCAAYGKPHIASPKKCLARHRKNH